MIRFICGSRNLPVATPSVNTELPEAMIRVHVVAKEVINRPFEGNIQQVKADEKRKTDSIFNRNVGLCDLSRDPLFYCF